MTAWGYFAPMSWWQRQRAKPDERFFRNLIDLGPPPAGAAARKEWDTRDEALIDQDAQRVLKAYRREVKRRAVVLWAHLFAQSAANWIPWLKRS